MKGVPTTHWFFVFAAFVAVICTGIVSMFRMFKKYMEYMKQSICSSVEQIVMANKLISGFTPPLPVPGLGSHEAPPPVQETVSGPPPMLNEVAKMLFNPASLIPSDFTVPPTEPKESSPPAPPAQPKEVTTEIQEIPASPRVHEEKPQQDEFFKLQQMKYEDLKNHLKNRFGITNVKGTKLDLIQRALKAEEESSAQS